MDFKHAICRSLHDEHQATVEALDGLEDLLAQGRRGVPDLDRPSVREMLRRLADLIQQEVRRHFAFEEDELFTRLADAGYTTIGEHLTADHRIILPIAEQVAALARSAVANGLNEAEWEDFRTHAAALIERLSAHIQKEDMGLLPLLDETLDADEDLELATTYSDMGA